MIKEEMYADIVAMAMREDLGAAGDITTDTTIASDATATAEFRTRQPGAVAGLGVARYVFETFDPTLDFETRVTDGDRVEAERVLAQVEGKARSILSAERTALNFLARMSGVATQTALLVDAVEGTGARISDTRKTMPGIRALDKYSVRMGGGVNHRFGLHDAVLIKDNHIAAVGSIAAAVESVRARFGHTVTVEVEVDSLKQLKELLETDTDTVLLDNMAPMDLAEAVSMVNGRMTTEASGGVTIETVREIAESGVDVISVGWVTHSAPQLDVGLDFV